MEKCSICQTDLMGEYCYNCGQRNTAKKISFKEMVTDFISGLFSLEHSVLGTLKHLVLNPERVIKNYWDGFRGYYHSPGKLAFYAAFFTGLHFTLIGNELLGLNISFTNIAPQLGLLIVLIPIFSLMSKLTFIKKKRTFLEHSIAMIYLFSCWFIIFLILDNLQRFLIGNLVDEGMFLLLFIVLFLSNSRVYLPLAKWYRIIFYTILEFVVLALIISVLVLILYLLPEGVVQLNRTVN